MTRTIAFIFNLHAGGGAGRAWRETNRQAVETVAAGGPTTVVENGAQIQAAVEALAQQCDTVVAGGGGTLNAVASKLLGLPTAFGNLPLGTLNHFAKDASYRETHGWRGRRGSHSRVARSGPRSPENCQAGWLRSLGGAARACGKAALGRFAGSAQDEEVGLTLEFCSLGVSSRFVMSFSQFILFE
jgi:hypothetical protein